MRTFRLLFLCLAAAALLPGLHRALAQSGDDAVRVTVTMNPDGSKTAYETNGASHRCIATTTGPNGKLREKIIYQLDDEGRYKSGEVFNGSGAFRFRSFYRYDSGGRLAEETQLSREGAVLHKIVYRFDAEGHPSGYAIYDGEGQLLGQTTSHATDHRR